MSTAVSLEEFLNGAKKTVAEMTIEEFREAVQQEATLVTEDLTKIAEGLTKIAEGLPDTSNQQIVWTALAVALLAKERVWRKDLDVRLTALEQR